MYSNVRIYVRYGLVLVIFFTLCIFSATAAPYTIDITPKSAEVSPGGTIVYTVQINAPPSFTDQIDFSFEVSSAGYQTVVNAGSYKGPYPKSFTYTLSIPSNIPAGLNANVIVNAKSSTNLEQVPLDISIKGAGGPVESIISAISSFINMLQSQIAGITGSKNS